MSRRLAQILVGDGVVKQSDVEEALQRQVLFGGSLGTNLLEAGSISEADLIAGLGKAHELPTAGKTEIDAIGAHLPRLFPQVFAESYHLVPYRLEGDQLGVLVTGEPDTQLLGRIRERLALQPQPAVTSEVRLHYAMNQLYGSELLPRIKALLSKLDGNMVMTEPAAAKPPGKALTWGVSSARVKPAAATTTTRVNLRELLAKLEFATDRDTIVEILMSAVCAIFDFAALFLVQGDAVNGWRGGDHDSTAKVARISMPVELPSVFQTIYATGGHYLGPLPNNSANGKLLSEMGRQAPRAAFVAPMIIGDRLAMMVYADNGARAISPRRVAAVLLLTQRCSVAFERLIRKRKAAAGRMMDGRPASEEWEEDVPIEFDLADEVTPQPRQRLADGDFEAITGGPVPAPIPPVKLTASASPTRPPASSFTGVDESPDAARQAFEAGIEAHAEDVVEIDDEYVAFADIDDSAEESLDGWGDVLIETADSLGVEAAPAEERSRPATEVSVTWDDVIQEALSASRFVPRPPTAPIEVAGTMVDETEILFDGLLATDPQVRRDAIERLLQLGTQADDGIRQRFPGEVAFDPLDPEARIPPFARCSGLTELLQARGADAAGVVLPFLESENVRNRFFAIYYLLAVHYPPALDSLARRLYDTEPRCRHLAADAIRTYSNQAGYQRIVEGLRGQLKVPVLESRIAAVQLLGQLRDPSCVPELIPMVVAPEPELARAAASALTVVCAQELGNDVAQWSEWWRENFNRPRPVWLIQGLRNQSIGVRRMANYELQLLTGMTTHFDAEASQPEREEKTRMWENWWLHVSKAGAAARASS